METTRRILASATLAIALSCAQAQAAQDLQVKGDETLAATISRSESTMIRIEGQPIRRIFGTEGEFAVVPDVEGGTAFIRPTTDKSVISVFVADHVGNTFKLLLAITNGPADAIVIKGATPKKGAVPSFTKRDQPRTQAIKNMIVALEAGDSLGLEERKVNQIVPLWNESRFVLRKIVDSGTVKGERYTLTNTSKSPMVIDERELYRKRVLAVSVQQPNLRPGESTWVNVVTESDDE